LAHYLGVIVLDSHKWEICVVRVHFLIADVECITIGDIRNFVLEGKFVEIELEFPSDENRARPA